MALASVLGGAFIGLSSWGAPFVDSLFARRR